MPRLLFHVEGQTEEKFVSEVLSAHLIAAGFADVRVRLAGNPRRQRGGIRPWQGIKRDILQHLKEDHSAIAAMMVDYYGLPNDWPGRKEAPNKHSPSEKAEYVESALLEDIKTEMGTRFDPRRFAPLVMMHEFEGLLFSDPDGFAKGLGRSEFAADLSVIRQGFASPEDINDSVETAPSKRIGELFPGYEKPLYGVIAAMEIGLPAMRLECRHFNDWLGHLESLPAACSYLDQPGNI